MCHDEHCAPDCHGSRTMRPRPDSGHGAIFCQIRRMVWSGVQEMVQGQSSFLSVLTRTLKFTTSGSFRDSYSGLVNVGCIRVRSMSGISELKMDTSRSHTHKKNQDILQSGRKIENLVRRSGFNVLVVRFGWIRTLNIPTPPARLYPI